jgi:lambda family phage portal protein
MDALDKVIEAISPGWALKRKQARHILRAYDAIKPSRLRSAQGSVGSADAVVGPAGDSLRSQARWLEENHDLSRGIINVMTQNIIGPAGITVEPQPRTRSGEIQGSFADDITKLMEDWSMYPEVTGSLSEARMQRLCCRSWIRDGEFFVQRLPGQIRGLDHNTVLPYSVELLEADMVPMDLDDVEQNIVQGIKKNGWGRPVAYYIYKQHPGDRYTYILRPSDLKNVNASRMLHVKMADRFGQTRGVSLFSSALIRLDDLKSYEESERVAARVAAAMTAVIRKGSPDLYQVSDTEDGARQFKMAPGMVFDQLRPGEDVEVIESNRPSALLTDFRSAMVRSVVSGVGATYSSVAKDYSGTYSAQRQELVEGYLAYRTLGQDFVEQFVRPLYRERLMLAISTGLLKVPREVDPRSLANASYHSHAMPWIDPAKEALGWQTLVQSGFESEEAVIRSRGRKPADVQSELIRFRKWAEENDLAFSSNVSATFSQAAGSADSMPAASDPAADDSESDQDEDEVDTDETED